MMESNFEPSSNNEELLLKQQILQEQSRRVMSDPNTIVVEPEASEEAHKEAIKKLLAQNPQK